MTPTKHGTSSPPLPDACFDAAEAAAEARGEVSFRRASYQDHSRLSRLHGQDTSNTKASWQGLLCWWLSGCIGKHVPCLSAQVGSHLPCRWATPCRCSDSLAADSAGARCANKLAGAARPNGRFKLGEANSN